MQIRDWFRPPRHVLTIFLAVALVSAATLALLAWLLVELAHQQNKHRMEFETQLHAWPAMPGS